MSYITISGTRYGNPPIHWAKKVPAKNFKIVEVKGYRIALVERSYYLSGEDNKIHFKKHTYDNCSWDITYDVYLEIERDSDLFHFSTSFNITERVGEATEILSFLDRSVEKIEAIIESGKYPEYKEKLVYYK